MGNKANESLEEAEKQFKEVESDVSALTRRIMLMEEEDKKSAESLCATVTKLAMTSKAADNVMKTIKVVENTCLNNEVTIEELDKKPEGHRQDGLRQRAEAGRAEQEAWCAGG